MPRRCQATQIVRGILDLTETLFVCVSVCVCVCVCVHDLPQEIELGCHSRCLRPEQLTTKCFEGRMGFDVIDSQADSVYSQFLTASVSFYLLRKTLLIKLNKSFHINIFPARAVLLDLRVCTCGLSDIKSVAKAREGCDYMEMAV